MAKTLNDIAGLSGTGNMMAQHMFWARGDGMGGAFFVRQSKGKFSLPDIIWDSTRFKIESARIGEFAEKLQTLVNELSAAGTIENLLLRQTSNATPGGLSLFGLPSP